MFFFSLKPIFIYSGYKKYISFDPAIVLLKIKSIEIKIPGGNDIYKDIYSGKNINKRNNYYWGNSQTICGLY